jgi:hypothetical protein
MGGGRILTIHFEDDSRNYIDLDQRPLESSIFYIDNEGKESGQIEVSGETGFWNRQDEMFTLMWMRGETGFVISSNALSVEEAVKIAESVRYRQ